MRTATKCISTRTILYATVQILAITCTSPSTATEGLCETPAGRRAQEVTDLVNSGNDKDFETYITDNYAPALKDGYPMTQHKGMLKSIQQMFGTLTLEQLTELPDNGVRAFNRSDKMNLWLHMDIRVEDEAPHRIASMIIKPGDAPPEFDPDSDSSGENQSHAAALPFSDFDELDTHIAKRAQADEFSGTVLVAENGRILFHKAYGYASKRFKVPNRLDTKFNLGSINKLFTSVAVARLMQEERIGLHDPLGKYLDGFSREASEKVMIQHLLQMRSGWGDYWGNETFLNNISRLRTVDAYMEFLKKMPLDFEPGTDQQHSNTGFDILGAIIEKVTGKDYFDVIRDFVYTPAGMTNSDSFDKDGPVENLAVGYTNRNPNDTAGEGYRWTNTYMMPPKGTPCGGGYTTAEDMLRFATALKNHTLLSAEYTHLLLRHFHESAPGKDTPKRPLMYAGGAPGINAFLGIKFEKGITVVVLSNYDMPAAIELGQSILDMMTSKEIDNDN